MVNPSKEYILAIIIILFIFCFFYSLRHRRVARERSNTTVIGHLVFSVPEDAITVDITT